jgi:hypothetical protein
MRVVAALCLLLVGCAHGRLPLDVSLVKPELSFVAGVAQRINVAVTNRTGKTVRVQRDADLHECSATPTCSTR